MYFSPAKINLGLSVVGRRSDGFHLLESLFWPVTLTDTVSIKKSEKNLVDCQWAEDAPVKTRNLPSMTENIAFRLLESANTREKLHVSIEKRIPIGGGLGGGSSNAGTVARHLGKIADTEKLGADIPFFLDPRPAWVTGIGETRNYLQVEKNLLDALSFVLILSPAQCITKEVFQEYHKAEIPFSKPLNFPVSETFGAEQLVTYLRSAKNDLESVVRLKEPVIADTIDFLRQTGAVYAGLSGSGSTCYAAFLSDADREKSLKDVHQFCRKYHCKSIKVQTFKTHS